MISPEEMRELLSYSSENPVLSVYLNTDPAQGNAEAYKLRLRTMLKSVDLTEDTTAIWNYIQSEYDWSGRSIAFFSCAADNFFRAYSLAVPVRERVRIAPSPHVKPLADLLDNYSGYAVALVDKQGTRLFYYHMGELVETDGLLGEEVRHTKRGGASQYPGRRGGVAGQTNYAEEVAERNMKEAADFAAHYFSEHRARRIILAGTEENTSMFRAQLPKTWQSLVVGVLPLSMTASKTEVFDRALEIIEEQERRQEAELINTIITAAAKGREGCVGLKDTLEAVKEGRVMNLVVQDGYCSTGYLCHGCGYLTVNQSESCPFCGSEFEKINDVVDLAVTEVMKSGGDVQIVRDLPSLTEAGSIGALLRY
jgi:peptide subunit release factor 1 (eRF1)